MNILEVQKKYNTQLKCYRLLEKLRWGKTVKCPYCSSKRQFVKKPTKHGAPAKIANGYFQYW